MSSSPVLSQDVEKRRFFAFFWKNDPLGDNFQNSFLKVFIGSPIDVLCSNFVKFGRREIGKVVVRYLPDKKNSPGSPAVAAAWIAPKICQSQPPTMYSQCSRFYPNRFTFGRVIPERVNIIKTGRKVFPIFGWRVASSRIIIITSNTLPFLANVNSRLRSLYAVARPSVCL